MALSCRGDRGSPELRAHATNRSPINVCTADRDKLVILNSDEQSQLTKAYFVSAAGALRKAVYYQAGDDAHQRSLKEARSDFAKELEFWTGLSAQSKPVGELR
jgi:hypothetical protein